MSKKQVSLFQLDYMISFTKNENYNGKIDYINKAWVT